MTLLRSGTCPNCGAPITFELGSSVSKVCAHCSHVIVRTDRDLSTIGKIAELVPTTPPFEVGDEIRVESRGARVAGRVQKDYGSGPWDELSIELDGGDWAWLARAQGRWYVTSRVDHYAGQLPSWDAVGAPGTTQQLGEDPLPWTVMERRRAHVVAARGEFAEPFAPNETSQYVDLVGPGDAFATLDYETTQSRPTLYRGRVLPAQSIALVRAALGPRPEQKVSAAKLSCPSCGAPIEIFDAQAAERVACAYCGAVMEPSTTGGSVALRHLATVAPLGQALTIPIGRRGKLRGVDVLVIGAMRRTTIVEGSRYDWLEYLLHSESGYLWLLQDNGHFTLIRDADPTKIGRGAVGGVTYEGRAFKAFFHNVVQVHSVAGEFYWKVASGDQTTVQDFIRPPHVLSYERTDSEATYSIGEYLEPRDVIKAFPGVTLPPRVGIAPAQPGPSVVGPVISLVLGLVMMIVFGIVLHKPSQPAVEWALPVRPNPASSVVATVLPGFGAALPGPEDTSNTAVSPSFVVSALTTLGVSLGVPQTNLDVSVDCALVNETTGDVREFVIDTGYYSGVAGGESWSEGSHEATAYVDRVEPGTYSVHVRSDWGSFTGDGAYVATSGYGGPLPPTPNMRVVQHERSAVCLFAALLLLLVPLGVAVLRAWTTKNRRWENSNLISHGDG